MLTSESTDSKKLHVVAAKVEHCCLPLKSPYVLSFATLETFEAILIQLHLDNGETWWGEVVPLPGYGSETVEAVLNIVQSWLAEIPGQTVQCLRQQVSRQITTAPFASSLILSAIDTGLIIPAQPLPDRAQIPLVYPTSSTKPELEQAIEQAITAGYRTIKVKVGECLEQDLDALPKLQRSLSPGVRVRFDANQGYTLAAARSFLLAIEAHLSEYTELVEQPLAPHAWAEMAQLAQDTPIPLMLDESIYTLKDVDRAKQIGCQWIKLKLCKQGGAQELLQMAVFAKQLGLKVVVGNGVATDISNWLELSLYHIYPQIFDGASESNGFAKLQQPLLHTALRVEAGCAVWKQDEE